MEHSGPAPDPGMRLHLMNILRADEEPGFKAVYLNEVKTAITTFDTSGGESTDLRKIRHT